MTQPNNELRIDAERCKGCLLCVEVCPKKALAMSKRVNKKGSSSAELAHPEACIMCGMCYTICPDVCIEIAPAPVQAEPKKKRELVLR